MEKIREEMVELFRDRLKVSIARMGQSYQKPYDHRFDIVPCPQGQGYRSFLSFLMKMGEAQTNIYASS
jgi:hypothetical protein